jgi:AcrR family transcriptional regulator
VTDPSDPRAGGTRQQIIAAAARQFARTPYDEVRLDDIIAAAGVTKGAIYFHFPSKHAVAHAVVDQQREALTEVVSELFSRKMSGLEKLVEIGFLVAAEDSGKDLMRAALNLMESVGHTGGMRSSYFAEWTKHFAILLERAIADGDVDPGSHPEQVSRVLVSLYLGIRQTSDPADTAQFVGQLSRAWAHTLPGFVTADRIGYFTEYIRRRAQRAGR